MNNAKCENLKTDKMIEVIKTENSKTPKIEKKQEDNGIIVTITAYSSRMSKTGKFANGDIVKKEHCRNIISLSKDLAKKYKFGTKFKLILNSGEIFYVIYVDRMHDKWSKRIDLLLEDNKRCKLFGRKKGKLCLIK